MKAIFALIEEKGANGEEYFCPLDSPEQKNGISRKDDHWEVLDKVSLNGETEAERQFIETISGSNFLFSDVVAKLMNDAYKLGRQRASVPQIPVWLWVEIEASDEEDEMYGDVPRFNKRMSLPSLPREGDKLHLNVGSHFHEFVVKEKVVYSEEYGGVYEVYLNPVQYDDEYKVKERIAEMIADFRDLDSGWE